MKISIITVTYNSAATLQDTIDSLLRQSYTDWEHIIVDGGSKDETLSIITANEARYGGHLRYISEKDNGIYDAMNKGIRMATGDVVGTLNSDDFFFDDNVLSRVADTLNAQSDLDAIYGDVRFVDAADLTHTVRYYSSRTFRPWKMRMGYMPAHPSFYCRKACFERAGLYNPSFRIAGDFEFLLRLLYIKKAQSCYLPFCFVTMRQGGVSTANYRAHLLINKEHLHALRANGVYSNIFFLSVRYIYRIYEAIYNKLKYNI